MEKYLSVSQRALLDRLYNLMSDDSEILKGINESIKENGNDFLLFNEKLSDLETNRKATSKKKSKLDSQLSAFVEEFKESRSDKYTDLLEEANIDFNPEDAVSIVKEVIPRSIEKIDSKLKDVDNEITKTRKSISECDLEKTELENKLSDAIQLKENLNNLIGASLEGNGSITRDSVQQILGLLSFEPDEITELGKMILFPQGTLTLYDDELYKIKDEVVTDFSDDIDYDESVIDFIEETTEVVVSKEEVIVEEPKEVIALPKSTEEKVVATQGIDRELIKMNATYLKELGFVKEELSKNESILSDKDLIAKIDALTSAGKEIDNLKSDIILITKYDLSELKKIVKQCDDRDIKLADVPFRMFDKIDNLIANNALLVSKGILLDDLQFKKNITTLMIDKDIFKNNMGIISKYHLSLDKKNNKYAIQCLAQDSNHLIKGIDSIIELGEEKLLFERPELLAMDLFDIANKIAYCKVNGCPLVDENNNYYEFIFMDEDFEKIFQNVTDKDYMIINNNAVRNNEMVKGLDGYKSLKDNDLNSAYLKDNIVDSDMYFKLMDVIKQLGNIEKNDNHYVIDDVVVSSERFERNALYLLTNNEDCTPDDLAVSALLYSSNYDDDSITKISDHILNNKMGRAM